jgi:hypothetical protein
MQAFIDDGYTRTVGFNEVPNMRPKLQFTYRPYVGLQRQKIQSRMLRGEENADQDFLKDIASRITDWNLSQTVSYESLTQMAAPLCECIANTFLGYQAPDYEVQPEGGEAPEPLCDVDRAEEDEKN